MSYDPSCYDLAESFLADEECVSEKVISDLAQFIQTSIEDWIQYGDWRDRMAEETMPMKAAP